MVHCHTVHLPRGALLTWCAVAQARLAREAKEKRDLLTPSHTFSHLPQARLAREAKEKREREAAAERARRAEEERVRREEEV